jgi:protein-L-isoaspartate(D-aspartate) O-methyltransferase
MNPSQVERARHNMIQQQIRPWVPIDDRVLDVLQSIPREDFVPSAYRNLAFADTEIPLADGSSMHPPRVEARMLDALHIRPNDNILEIGTGNGYLTACLARLGGYVTSLDQNVSHAAEAGKRLHRLGIHNVSLSKGDCDNLPGGSFDVVVLNGSLRERNEALEQVLTQGGRLYAVIGESPAMEACLIVRGESHHWHCQGLFETDLPGSEQTPSQSFDF